MVGGYGSSIIIPTPSPASISSVSLVRLMASTHHYDANAKTSLASDSLAQVQVV